MKTINEELLDENLKMFKSVLRTVKSDLQELHPIQLDKITPSVVTTVAIELLKASLVDTGESTFDISL